MKTFYLKIIEFIKKYHGHLSSWALIIGFVIDNLTFSRVDNFYANAILVFYLIVIGVSILIFNFVEMRGLTTKFAERVKIIAPIIIQFTFGNLFSAFFVFYSRSGTFWESWPFILLIIGLLILNEFLKKQYSIIIYQISVYFFVIFSYMIFLVPVLLREMGQLIFIYSGIISLAFIYFFTVLIHVVANKKYYLFNKKMWLIIFVIYVLINIFYFTNILPPLPLSMKNSGIYNSIEKKDNGYYLSKENLNFFQRFFDNYIVIGPNDRVFYFSSIFAPSRFKIGIFHEWQYFDVKNKKWVSAGKIPFIILGGRDSGYRGYSFKNNLKDGKWRIFTKTENGQVIGKEEFRVILSDKKPDLIFETK